MKTKQTMIYKTLNRALSVKRPHNTTGSAQFTEWLHTNLPRRNHIAVTYDAAGNLHVDARLDPTHRTLFVAHVDTVHHTIGANKIRKTTAVWYADGSQLGADDGVGCALLMHMLHAGVPGYYVFTQGEERGGIGAKHLAEACAPLLTEFDRAIAFDRKGTDSIITHQGYGRCCSDEFGDALATALNATDNELMYSPDDTGVYTDTAEFTGIIPECTNVSCGYMYEHSDREQLDMIHFDLLAKAVLAVKWDALPTRRDPTIPDPDDVVVFNSWANYKDSIKTCPTNDSFGTWPAYDTSDLTEDEYLYECLLDAQQGFLTGVITLMAQSVYPEEPEMAVKFIDRKKLTDDAITMAMGMCGHNDVDSILCTLFDMAYAE